MAPVHTSMLQSHLLSQPRYTTRDTIVWRPYLGQTPQNPAASVAVFHSGRTYPRNRFTYRFLSDRSAGLSVFRAEENRLAARDRVEGATNENDAFGTRTVSGDEIGHSCPRLGVREPLAPRYTEIRWTRVILQLPFSPTRSHLLLKLHSLSLSLSRTFIPVSDLGYRLI